jgi:hypothetical protein
MWQCVDYVAVWCVSICLSLTDSGFSGLGVSMLASGTHTGGFEPRFFRAKKSSACLPSEGKSSRRSHVADLQHVKDPFKQRGNRYFTAKLTGHFSPIVPLSLLEVFRVVGVGAPGGTSGNVQSRARTISLQAAVLRGH